ncbi:sialate:O-sulfotransferase 1-like [Saccoglossus kowalevskii]|uniref:Uncharacterized protein LOC100367968 n=1 Tax=Saccoglossus kowalevskii TaxID=10224 RepID=A0ABM0M329_SACKO|nr:PREDICTED: uncharacterized protein LOC100367968 [Saccoglossus kowalevskii]
MSNFGRPPPYTSISGPTPDSDRPYYTVNREADLDIELGHPTNHDNTIPIQVSLTALRMQKASLEKEVRKMADQHEKGLLMQKITELTYQKRRLESALSQARQARAAIVGMFSSEKTPPNRDLEVDRSTPPPPTPEKRPISLESRGSESPVVTRIDRCLNYRRRIKWLFMGMLYKLSRIKNNIFRSNGRGGNDGSLFSGKRGLSLAGLVLLSVLLVYTQIRLIKHVDMPRETAPPDRCGVRFAPAKSRPTVALASFPGSGNTWVRHLIEQATTYYTGNVKRSSTLETAGFKGENEDWRSGTTVVQKTHDFSRDLIRRFQNAILLIRNPYKAMLAEASRQYAGKTGYAPMNIYYNEQGWDLYVKKYSSEWESQISQWLLFHERPLILVRYEDMKDNPIYELRKISNFLNMTLEDRRVACVVKNLEGRFHRPDDHNKFLGFNPFTEEMHKDIEERIERVNDLLEVRGYKHVARVYPG